VTLSSQGDVGHRKVLIGSFDVKAAGNLETLHKC